METMKIMVDLDRVVFDCPSPVFILANHLNKKINKTQPLKYVEVDEKESMNYSSSLSFFQLFNDEVLVEVDGSIKTLQNWNKQGFDIHFVSSRPNLKPMKRATVKWLKKNNINYSKLIFACSNKAEYCKQNKIDVMVDDNYKNCKDARSEGIPAVWLVDKFNRYDATYFASKLNIATNWHEINNFVQSINRTKQNTSIK